MSLSTGHAQMHSALKTLRLHWGEVKQYWNDMVRDEFEKHHLDPLEAQVRSTLRALERLAALVGQMEQETG